MSEHAELSASGAERWMNCPGSVRMSRGLPNVESEYARLGTRSHEYAAGLLLTPKAARLWDHGLPDDYVDAVHIYVDEVSAIMARYPDARLRVEQSFSLDAFNPPAPMFGTADAVVVSVRAGRLVVVDLKTGAGVVKEAEENPQLYYYALGALLAVEHSGYVGKIHDIEVVVVQPRAPHPSGTIRRHVLGYLELVEFAADVLGAAQATMVADAPLKPGPWCQFCPAGGACPARYKAAQAVAQVEFADLPRITPPDPATLPIETLVHVFNNSDVLESWLRAVREYLQGAVERGATGLGLKLVAKRANRKWIDEAAVEDFIRQNEVDADDAFDVKLKSPAQLEKVLKHYKLPLPEELYHKQSSGVTLVSETDPRPGVQIDPAHEFAALPPARSDNENAAP